MQAASGAAGRANVRLCPASSLNRILIYSLYTVAQVIILRLAFHCTRTELNSSVRSRALCSELAEHKLSEFRCSQSCRDADASTSERVVSHLVA